jgi:O-antigen/teichoic acid export membrane protein
MKIIEVLMVISGFYLNSVLPKLTKYFEKNKKEKLQKLLIVSFKILFSF